MAQPTTEATVSDRPSLTNNHGVEISEKDFITRAQQDASELFNTMKSWMETYQENQHTVSAQVAKLTQELKHLSQRIHPGHAGETDSIDVH
jgi:hypothetical protein